MSARSSWAWSSRTRTATARSCSRWRSWRKTCPEGYPLANLHDAETAGWQRWDARVRRRPKPLRPLCARQNDDLAVVVGRDVGAGLHGQHGETLLADKTRDAEELVVGGGEQPFGLGSLVAGELVEAVGRDQAATVREAPAVRAEVDQGATLRLLEA